MASSATRTPSSTTIPVTISLGLSRNGRRAFCGAAAAARLGVISVTVAGTLLLGVQQILELVGELVDVAEMPVDGRKPDVGDFVQPFELLHYKGTDVGGGDLFLGPLLQRGFNAVRDAFEGGHADRTLLARLEQPRDQLLPLEPLARSVLLDHHVRDLVDPLVAGEPFPAVQALAASPDDFPLLRLSRIDDLVSQVAAIRTLQV